MVTEDGFIRIKDGLYIRPYSLFMDTKVVVNPGDPTIRLPTLEEGKLIVEHLPFIVTTCEQLKYKDIYYFTDLRNMLSFCVRDGDQFLKMDFRTGVVCEFGRNFVAMLYVKDVK
jgi:hypothetical protein